MAFCRYLFKLKKYPCVPNLLNWGGIDCLLLTAQLVSWLFALVYPRLTSNLLHSQD